MNNVILKTFLPFYIGSKLISLDHVVYLMIKITGLISTTSYTDIVLYFGIITSRADFQLRTDM